MEIVLALAIIGVGLIWYYNNKKHSAPANPEPKTEVPQSVVESVPEPEQKANGTWPFPTSVPPAEPEPMKAKKPVAKKPVAKKVPAKPAAIKAAKKPAAKKAKK